MSEVTADLSEPTAGPPAGGRAIFLGQMWKAVVRLFTAATLARLLTPEIYGLYGMVLVVYSLLYMAKDFGIGTALQQPEFSRTRFNALFRLGLVGGIGLAALGAVLGPPVARFYREPPLAVLLGAFSIGLLFAASAAPALGLLYRERKIRAIAVVDATAMTVSSLAGIVAAKAGLGVWSLVVLSLVNEVVACVGYWWASPWKPAADTGNVRWRDLLGFGAHLTGYSMINYCSRNVDQPAVGWAWGSTALGYYGRAVQLTVMPVQFGIAPFNSWIIAGLARLQADPGNYARLFRQKLNNLLHVSLPLALACVTVPELGVALLFGPRWLEAAPMVRWLGVALAVQPWLFAPAWLLESTGQVRRLLGISVLGFALAASACLLAVSHGALAVAQALAAATVIQVLVSAALCQHCTPASFSDWWQPALVPLALHGGFALVMLAVKTFVPVHVGVWPRAGLIVGLGALYYSALWFASARVRGELRGHFLWPR
jgi:PST family polysaccharide transporter